MTAIVSIGARLHLLHSDRFIVEGGGRHLVRVGVGVRVRVRVKVRVRVRVSGQGQGWGQG